MRSVLIVDSPPLVRESLAKILQWDGFHESYTVFSVANGSRLLGTLDGAIDVAVVELNLPNEEEMELLRKMHEAYPEMPILVLTLVPEREIHDRLREMGAEEVLPKSASLEEVLAAIRRLASG